MCIKKINTIQLNPQILIHLTKMKESDIFRNNYTFWSLILFYMNNNAVFCMPNLPTKYWRKITKENTIHDSKRLLCKSSPIASSSKLRLRHLKGCIRLAYLTSSSSPSREKNAHMNNCKQIERLGIVCCGIHLLKWFTKAETDSRRMRVGMRIAHINRRLSQLLEFYRFFGDKREKD